jgi:hypothetical protein
MRIVRAHPVLTAGRTAARRIKVPLTIFLLLHGAEGKRLLALHTK